VAAIDCRAGEEIRVGELTLVMLLGWEGEQLSLWIDVPEDLRPECDGHVAQLMVSAEGYCLYLLRVPDGAIVHLQEIKIQIRRLRAPSGIAQLRDTRINVQTPHGGDVVRVPQRAARRTAARPN
jgi:hypothetical protein